VEPLRICLVSTEVAPFVRGGIALYVHALARTLSPIAEVTVVTRDAFAQEHAALERAGSPELPPGVRYEFVPAPDDRVLKYAFGPHHAWSAAALATVETIYGGDGPDLLEVPDYHAAGFALVQAKRSRHRTLERTRIAVRVHSSWELCALFDAHPVMSRDERVLCAMERYVLRKADLLLWPGGDVHSAYERFYGRDGLAPAVRIRHPLPAAERADAHAKDGPLSFVFVGRMQRLKGVLDIVRGFMRHAGDDWRLTLIGGDTATGPAGTSMQATVELMTVGDRRITITGTLPRAETAAVVRAHDVFVMPSLWECWPYAVLEAMQADRPVLATSVGGHREQVAEGSTGWLVRPGAEALGDALGRLLRRPDAARAITRDGAPSARASALTDEDAIRAAYSDLARAKTAAPPTRRRKPLVSVVIPYDGTAAFVAETVASIDAQTYPQLEIVVIDDGSLRAEGRVLDMLESNHRLRVLHQPARGLGGARNAGILQSHGRYVLALDPDTCPEPTFVERCVALLECDRALAYVTSWSRHVDADGNDVLGDVAAGSQPLGNDDAVAEDYDVAGDAAAVWPRRLFDRGFRYSETVPSIEDWTLYRRMRRAGLYGQVIPERLLWRRSVPRTDGAQLDDLCAFATAELRLEEVEWNGRD
jgi:glycosyltransferase involved in cell wall biosynthesis